MSSKIYTDPIADRVIIEPDEPVTKTDGGLYLPDQAIEKPKTGTILAVGPNTEQIETGDRVWYSRNAGIEVELEKDNVLIVMKEKDVLFIFDDRETDATSAS